MVGSQGSYYFAAASNQFGQRFILSLICVDMFRNEV